MEKVLGICIGAATIKLVELDIINHEPTLTWHKIIPHECNPAKVLTNTLNQINVSDYVYVATTGQKFKEFVTLPTVTEPEVTELAYKYVQGILANRNPNNAGSQCSALVSLGSENFILYSLDTQGHIINVHTGNKCASGTGEFFLQQIRRMNLTVEKAVAISRNVTPHRVSGRCSVFCKSDCTHALNIGSPLPEITAGLCQMMANKVIDLLLTNDKKNIMVVGGVTQNDVVMDFLRKEITNLVIPQESVYFEPLGAALYAWQNKTKFDWHTNVIKSNLSSFCFLPPLSQAEKYVTFHQLTRSKPEPEDECILGLDAGSTTTKSVLIRVQDNSILADVYLRTNGDPVTAARNCYRALAEQLNGTKVKIIGLGTTGSGRQITGLHALTDAIINEIIAHATAAVHFDPQVDTIFEIGGQDAKYTHLVNGVPCDYAMNEACSAGTGSFLEESAKESLGVDYREIEKIARRAQNPPNFNDQCSAFISSDIKNAAQEGINREDIIAGLVYSICLNYNNRVKGNRPVGNTIFMQGGVCYNQAVPLAMANLVKKKIVVPPEPGLMGALGVTLELKRRIELGLLSKTNFDLNELVNREITCTRTFTCTGKSENCDRGCKINVFDVNGQKFPFGGICNKYYNQRLHIKVDTYKLNYVHHRQENVFTFTSSNIHQTHNPKYTVGLTKSFLTNTLYPLYSTFFHNLGYRTILSEEVDRTGLKRTCTAHCFPGELSHGYFLNLVNQKPDYVFLPHITENYIENNEKPEKEHQCTCVLLQSEPYFLRSAFKPEFEQVKVLTPVINFAEGLRQAEPAFIQLAKQMNVTNVKLIKTAYHQATKRQSEFVHQLKLYGEEMLNVLSKEQDKFAVIIFGRSYNAFAKDANLGIPEKFASRGIICLPYDALPFTEEILETDNMCWASGQDLLRAARLVKKQPQLYGCYITNFSCGPDSFLLTYFRDIMGTKPSLTLELDSHSADAGINTRVEAFLDIIDRYRKLRVTSTVVSSKFTPAELVYQKHKISYRTSDGKSYPLTDKRIQLIFPSMGQLVTEAVAASFRSFGFNADALPVSDYESLMKGRGNATCKECLPLLLTTGSLLRYLEERTNPNELLLYFMPTTSGSCRFSQYSVYLNRLIKKKKIDNVALLTLNSETGYAGLGPAKSLKIVHTAIIADVMDDIKNTLYVTAQNRNTALETFNRQWNFILHHLTENKTEIHTILNQVAHNLAKIPLRFKPEHSKIVYLLGEIFVRRDEFSCQNIVERLAKRDIIVHRAPVLEWLYYVDYLVKKGVIGRNKDFSTWLEFWIKQFYQRSYEKKVKLILSQSGLYPYHLIDIDKLVQVGKNFVNLKLTGEAILSIGSFFTEIVDHIHGVISIGPFACLPTRIVESILTPEATVQNKINLCGNGDHKYAHLQNLQRLPFLSLESDGNPFPPIINARIESFCLQVERLHRLCQTQLIK